MDNFIIHLNPIPRAFPHSTQVGSIGYIPSKTQWCDNPFTSFNYSFILKGTGEYRLGGKSWEVKAPCVITQWPGVHVTYGPHKMWEELYLTYDEQYMAVFEKAGMADMSKPVWYISDPVHTRRKLADLREHLADVNEPGRVDEVDRICDAMVLESLISEARPGLDEKQRLVNSIRAHVEDNYLSHIDYDELALDYNLSPASFRRLWASFVGVPPARYVMGLRIRQACRMLVETQKSIGEIADELSFDDPLYFSRKFRKLVGETATDYRRKHRAPLSLGEVV
ncbi:MAG: helix-turn-helix transcriptional regulator [Planctomycetes bacterium]|nr:helix-turn-helix transcriptional regulator [Planctomycetota bacterium]